MKKRIIIIILLIILIIIGGVGYFVYDDMKQEAILKQEIVKLNNKDLGSDNYDIKINYPLTGYKKLNEEITKIVNNYMKDFKNKLPNKDIQVDMKYTLIIDFKDFYYNDYVSFVFYIEYFTGGAHPNHEIVTINYDKRTNSFIKIENLLEKNKDILDIFSKISRINLINNPKITVTSMMYEGTKPIKDNFKNFVFTKDGILLLFNYYQVAPYSQGEFQIIVPYSYIK